MNDFGELARRLMTPAGNSSRKTVARTRPWKYDPGPTVISTMMPEEDIGVSEAPRIATLGLMGGKEGGSRAVLIERLMSR